MERLWSGARKARGQHNELLYIIPGHDKKNQ